MRGWAILLPALLAACGDKPADAPVATEQATIARSVADVEAAEAAAATPLPLQAPAAEVPAKD